MSIISEGGHIMSDPIRVLHVVYILNRGGMESRIMDIYRNLDSSKVQYDFYVESGEHGAFEEEVLKRGGRIYYPKKKGNGFFPQFSEFNSFLKKHKEYKIVFAYNQWSGEYLKCAYKNNVKVRVANARTAIIQQSLKDVIKNLVKRPTNKYTTHRFAVSKLAGEWLFGKNSQFEVWPNAIDSKKYMYDSSIRSSIRKELEIDDAYVIIHVGNFTREKNHDFILQVFKKVQEEHSSAKLLLVGGGDIQRHIESVKAWGIEDKVLFLGSRNDVNRLLSAGDAFLFPSLFEGFPGAVLEAEASGLPCVISDTITEEVDIQNNIVRLSLKNNTVEEWAKEIVNVSSNNRGDAWQRIYSAGYDIKENAKKMEQFLVSSLDQ